MSKNLKIALFSILVVVLIGSIVGANYYFAQIKPEMTQGQTSDTIQSNYNLDSNTNKTITTPTLQVDEIKIKPMFEGKAQKLEQDLGILLENNGYLSPIGYYEAGKFLDGKYKGYTRIIAITAIPYAVENHYFATKDYEKFVLLNYTDYGALNINLNTLEMIDNNGDIFNQEKIVAVDYVESELPQTFHFDKVFSARQGNLYLDNSNELSLNISADKYKKLSFPATPFDIYSPLEFDYLSGTSAPIVIVDSSGLQYMYTIEWRNNLGAKTMKLAANEFYNYDKIFVDLSFESSKLSLDSKVKTFKTYSDPFPVGCGIFDSLDIVDVPQNELNQIGTIEGLPLYELKDKNNNLYQRQYKAKVESQSISFELGSSELPDPEYFSSINNGMKMPTFEEYVAQNPLLLFKDPFDRLILAGESDFIVQGECGKPVIYLYPSTETPVNVKFLAQMQLTTDIPRYVENLGWNVLAKPNGELSDLQTEYTDCDIFDKPHTGSEYAKEACKTNNYPYLYWSGNRIGAEYPEIDKGWIVAKADLNKFLNSKLDEIGLNQTEKSDMLEYWIPYLSDKPGEYFRISFLQTKEMNALAPMQITPRPDKVFRIFLDWDNYNSKPDFEIQPQKLETLKNRDGFTVVEWGGLKK